MVEIKNNNPPSHRLAVTPASYILLRRNDEVLLLRRFNTGYKDGYYSLPAGHFDGAESAIDVAIREVKEEVGVTVKRDDLKLVHVLHRVAEESGYERIDFFFEMEVWEGEVTNMEPNKCDELRWCLLNALPDNLTPEVQQALAHIQRGSYYSDLDF